jgi:hypothetical protein
MLAPGLGPTESYSDREVSFLLNRNPFQEFKDAKEFFKLFIYLHFYK